jgi:hypothetical protein
LQVGDRFGPAPEAFGHGGAGGSLHGTWPEQRIAFSYVTNLLRDDDRVNDRAHSVLRALWSSARDSRLGERGVEVPELAFRITCAVLADSVRLVHRCFEDLRAGFDAVGVVRVGVVDGDHGHAGNAAQGAW